jgi:membrane protease YdiL (CAAX protease family)
MASFPGGPDPPGPAPLLPSTIVPPPLRPAPGRREIVLVLGLVFVLNLALGFALLLAGLRTSLLVTQALAFALPPVWALRLFYLDRRAVLPFGLPASRHVVAAVCGTLGLNHLLTFYGAWQERVWPQPEALRASTEALLSSNGALDLVALLAAIALVPAFCEEILFRGFVQSGLVRQAARPWSGVIATAVIFGLFHLDPWRFFLVVPLGIFLGWLREASGSMWPAILAHGLNNTMTVAMTSAGLAAAGRAPGNAGTALLAAGLVTLALFAGRRRPGSARERVL